MRQGSKLSPHISKHETKSCLPLTSLDFNWFHLKSVVFLHNAIVTITIKNGLISDGGGVQTASLAAFLFVAWGVRRWFTGSSTGRMVCRNQRKKGCRACNNRSDHSGHIYIYMWYVCSMNSVHCTHLDADQVTKTAQVAGWDGFQRPTETDWLCNLLSFPTTDCGHWPLVICVACLLNVQCTLMLTQTKML